MNLITRQKIWWLISLFMFVSAILIFFSFKPSFLLTVDSFILGLMGGAFSYFIGLIVRSYLKRQSVKMWGTILESVIISPLIEEILFRYALLVLLLGFSIESIIIASIIWALFHFISEIASGYPFKYYRTTSGFIDAVSSGLIFSLLFVASGFNLFVPWVSHAVHNLLVLSPIPLRISSKSVLQLRGMVACCQSVFSTSFLFSSCRIIRIRMLISLILKRKVIKE